MHELVNLPPLSDVARIRQLRFLDRVAQMPSSRLTRQIISCQAQRKPDSKLKQGRRTSTQGTYRETLEKAGLCTKEDRGNLSKWIPKFHQGDLCETIETSLNLPEGTYKKGRRNLKENKTILNLYVAGSQP